MMKEVKTNIFVPKDFKVGDLIYSFNPNPKLRIDIKKHKLLKIVSNVDVIYDYENNSLDSRSKVIQPSSFVKKFFSKSENEKIKNIKKAKVFIFSGDVVLVALEETNSFLYSSSVFKINFYETAKANNIENSIEAISVVKDNGNLELNVFPRYSNNNRLIVVEQSELKNIVQSLKSVMEKNIEYEIKTARNKMMSALKKQKELAKTCEQYFK